MFPQCVRAMNQFDLFETVLASEDTAISFLQKHGIFTADTASCPGKKGHSCDGKMRIGTRKIKKDKRSKFFICPRKNCRTSRSLRSTNNFFSHRDNHGKSRNNLSLVQIIHYIYEWLYSSNTVNQTVIKTGLAKRTVNKWNNLCREVCQRVILRQRKFVGTEENPVQIDEAYFSGKRKYNRGRFRKGDYKAVGEDQARLEEERCAGDKHYGPYTTIQNKRNFGGRVVGPWVFGIYWSKFCVRFFVIPDRKGETLIPIIKAHVEPSSLVVSDEWKGYSRLEENGYVHETVCHKTHFVNPNTGFHTQAIERAWIEGKAFIKRARYPTVNLQSHLDEVSWRMLRRNHPDGLFSAFLHDIRDCYSTYVV